MQVTDARKMNAAEIAALMKKKAFDEVELSPRIQAGTDAMFGRHMTAAQVVEQIVADVRAEGDEKLFYTRRRPSMLWQMPMVLQKMSLSVSGLKIRMGKQR